MITKTLARLVTGESRKQQRGPNPCESTSFKVFLEVPNTYILMARLRHVLYIAVRDSGKSIFFILRSNVSY